MNKITAYVVLRGTVVGDEESLEQQVQKYLTRGWQPLGPAMPISSNYAIQTMVTYAGQ